MKDFQDISYLNLNVAYRTGGYYSPPLGTKWAHSGTHPFCQNKFYFVTEGTFSITIEGKTYKAKPNDWFFIPAGAKHNFHNYLDKPMSKYWLHFDIFPSNELLKGFNVNYRVNTKNQTKVMELFKEFGKICNSSDFSDILRVKAIILNLIAEYLKLAGKQKNITIIDEQNENLRAVLTYIADNFTRNLTTYELAKVCHLHPTHFIRTFKLKMAQTPQQYILNMRMEYAKNLLSNTTLPVTEISEQIGFNDTAHFSKAFKNFYSITPTQFRKQLNEK